MNNMPDKRNPDADEYQHWLNRRAHYFAAPGQPAPSPADAHRIELQFLVRAQGSQLDLLADTLDGLINQSLADWHLDVISEAPPPAGIDAIPCLSWHVSATAEWPETLKQRDHQDPAMRWIMEIPAGARLDPAFIFRLASEAGAAPDAVCFFCDDDVTDIDGVRSGPRFKFGVNPSALLSSDLAGPVCVRGDAWAALGGAAPLNENPWFSQLLRVAKRHGWHSIRHIPDVLISYPDAFPTDPASSMAALASHFRRTQTVAEIIPYSSRGWHIRHQLAQPPAVSIAILSTGQLDLLSRCCQSILENTDYPDFEIIIALTDRLHTADLEHWLARATSQDKPRLRVIPSGAEDSHAARCNAAVAASMNDFVLLVAEQALFVQKNWLGELVRSGIQAGVAGVSPCLIQPGSALIREAGNTLGLGDIIGSPYQDAMKLGEAPGYLDCLLGARDVSILPADCMLLRRESYIRAGGMDGEAFGDSLSAADLCLKIRGNGERLVFQPLANVVCGNATENSFETDETELARQRQARARNRESFYRSWYPQAATDPFWNANLTLADNAPSPEGELLARWQFIPADLPRILAHTLANASGDFRIGSPLKALSQAGLVSECICRQRLTGRQRNFSPAEIIRLNPDSVIVQNYIHNTPLAMLNDWAVSGHRPFTVYALDDLITGVDSGNPNSRNIPENTCARLHYALQRCDRLVVTTDYLANAYAGYIADIRIVPNRLETETWLPLRSLRRTGRKPRIGWAGGNTHRSDLLLLKEIIEHTRDEADWIFFGMCPDEIRPLLAEYHPPVEFGDYPARLASLNLDLAVAPLCDTPFNRGKSNLRLLEFGILGIPVVCSDLEPYQNSPACRVSNTPTAWIDALRARFHDPDAREREGDALRRWVGQDYLLEDHLPAWLAAHLPA